MTVLLLSDPSLKAQEPSREDFEYLASATPRIVCMKPDMKTGFGSGSGAVIYHEPGDNAYILTARHVVDDCDEKGGKLYARATSTTRSPFGRPDGIGKTYFAVTILSQDKDTDLAILKTISRFDQQLTFLRMSKELPYPGQPIYIAGFPAPMSDDFQINYGIVSMIKQIHEGTKYYARAFVIDAYTYFGNSGGPVVDNDMKIRGVAVLIVGGFVEPSFFGKPTPPGPSRGWAISTQEVWRLLKKDPNLKYLQEKLTAYESEAIRKEATGLERTETPAQNATSNPTPSR